MAVQINSMDRQKVNEQDLFPSLQFYLSEKSFVGWKIDDSPETSIREIANCTFQSIIPCRNSANRPVFLAHFYRIESHSSDLTMFPLNSFCFIERGFLQLIIYRYCSTLVSGKSYQGPSVFATKMHYQYKLLTIPV